MYKGIDTVARLNIKQAHILKDNGISFVGRYLVPEAYSKALTAQEVSELHSAGLAILLCWEIGASAVKGGAARGAQDGTYARSIAERLGVPAGTTIYFAVDYNITQNEYALAEEYIKAAQTALEKYDAGIYGHERLVDYLSTRFACAKYWQCVAWSQQFCAAANVRQYAWQNAKESTDMAQKIGVAVDMDKSDDMEGFWMPKEDHGKKPWYDTAMSWVEKNGIMMDGRPNDPVTRAEVATMLMRYHAKFGDEDSKNDSGLLS